MVWYQIASLSVYPSIHPSIHPSIYLWASDKTLSSSSFFTQGKRAFLGNNWTTTSMRQIHAAEGNPFLQPLLLIDLLVQPGRGCQYGGGVQGSLGKKMQEVWVHLTHVPRKRKSKMWSYCLFIEEPSPISHQSLVVSMLLSVKYAQKIVVWYSCAHLLSVDSGKRDHWFHILQQHRGFVLWASEDEGVPGVPHFFVKKC